MKKYKILTRRLVLKPLGSEYLQTVNEYAMDYENTKYMCHLPNKNAEETVSFLRNVDVEWEKEKPARYEFAILYRDNHIGAVGIDFTKGIGELGWIVNKKYWGNGFAYEAAQAIMKYFTDNMGTAHFIAHCDTKNAASYKVMENSVWFRLANGVGGGIGLHGRIRLNTSMNWCYKNILGTSRMNLCGQLQYPKVPCKTGTLLRFQYMHLTPLCNLPVRMQDDKVRFLDAPIV